MTFDGMRTEAEWLVAVGAPADFLAAIEGYQALASYGGQFETRARYNAERTLTHMRKQAQRAFCPMTPGFAREFHFCVNASVHPYFRYA